LKALLYIYKQTPPTKIKETMEELKNFNAKKLFEKLALS